MVEQQIVYEGKLHCKATHGPSSAVLTTDAPKDNMGQGRSSRPPTSLPRPSLPACSPRWASSRSGNNIDMTGSTARVVKDMVTAPVRRVGTLTCEITVPTVLTDEQQTRLRKAALHCPVHRSLHPDVQFRSPLNGRNRDSCTKLSDPLDSADNPNGRWIFNPNLGSDRDCLRHFDLGVLSVLGSERQRRQLSQPMRSRASPPVNATKIAKAPVAKVEAKKPDRAAA